MPKLEVYDAAKKGEKKARSYIKGHPWQSVGIAALVGATLAAIFRRRK